MKKLLSILLVSAMTIGLVACGNEAAAPAPADTPAATEDTAAPAPEPAATEDSAPAAAGELTIAIWDNNQEPGLSEIVADFTEKTGIKATIQVTPWDQYWTMLEAGATGGSLPDVFWMHSNEFTKYAEYDMLLDLTDKIAASSDIDLANYPADIVGLYNYDGKQLAVPKDYDTIALWYNKTMFDEAGIAYPNADWTWDDLADAAKKLTKDDGSQYGYACATSNNQDGWYNIVYSMGGEIINKDKTKSGMDEDATIKAVKFVSDLVKGGYTPPYEVMAENNPEALLTAGTVAMGSSGSWMLSAVTGTDYAKANLELAVLPKDKTTGRRVSIYNGLGWAASGNTDKPEEAWKLIEYLGSKEAQQKQSDLGIVISAYQGTEKNWINANPDFNLQAYLDMTGDMEFRPYSKHTTVWENYITEDLVPVWTGEADAEEVCKSIAEKMNAALAEE